MQLLETERKEVPLLDCDERHKNQLIVAENVVELKLLDVIPSAQVPALKGTIVDIYA